MACKLGRFCRHAGGREARTERHATVLTWGRAGLALLLVLGWAGGWPARTAAAPPPPEEPGWGAGPAAPLACDPDGVQASGAVYRICMPGWPVSWNGDLVVYAHGYVSPTRPVEIPEDQMSLPGGISVPGIVTTLGYAFATTSYRTNGLAVLPGIEDLVDLVTIFAAEKGVPDRVYLAGVSEGGLIATLAVERHPELFDGGLAMCGPYGDFRAQVDYWGDFRVAFDYFFPDVMPPDPVDIPAWLVDGWDDYYVETVRPVIEDPANAAKVDQLLEVAGVPTDPADPSTREAAFERLLWYNAMATNDGRAKLGGQPFDNQDRTYAGSDDDTALNAGVQRFGADLAALAEMAAHYQTSGWLAVPLVTLHTTGDPLVPEWHGQRYQSKAAQARNPARHEHRAVPGFGHCAFDAWDVLAAFGRLVAMVNNPPPDERVRVYLPAVVRGFGVGAAAR